MTYLNYIFPTSFIFSSHELNLQNILLFYFGYCVLNIGVSKLYQVIMNYRNKQINKVNLEKLILNQQTEIEKQKKIFTENYLSKYENKYIDEYLSLENTPIEPEQLKDFYKNVLVEEITDLANNGINTIGKVYFYFESYDSNKIKQKNNLLCEMSPLDDFNNNVFTVVNETDSSKYNLKSKEKDIDILKIEPEIGCFYYYADRILPSKYLETICRKYCIQFNCKSLNKFNDDSLKKQISPDYINYLFENRFNIINNTLKKSSNLQKSNTDSPPININPSHNNNLTIRKKIDLYKKAGINTSKTSVNDKNELIINLNIVANKFKHLGKLCEGEFLFSSNPYFNKAELINRNTNTIINNFYSLYQSNQKAIILDDDNDDDKNDDNNICLGSGDTGDLDDNTGGDDDENDIFQNIKPKQDLEPSLEIINEYKKLNLIPATKRTYTQYKRINELNNLYPSIISLL